ncbi:MAG: hypothetical protein ACJAZP_002998 [Psychromonas sp.]|jgi:hypothetical protein
MSNASAQVLKIAFASSNNIDLDEHVRTCFSLSIYAGFNPNQDDGSMI